MALAVEAALTAVELIDAGWSRLTRGKTKAQQVADDEERASLEDRALELEGELAREKVEHQKLQAAIEEYKHLLLKLHEERGLGLAGSSGNKEPDLAVDTAKLIQRVEDKVNSPAFLDHLLAPPGAQVVRGDGGTRAVQNPAAFPECFDEATGTIAGATGAGSSGTTATSSGGLMEVCIDEDEATECWQWVTARELRGGLRTSTEPCSGLDGEEDYELVEGEDVVDAISLVLARYIATHPDYTGLSSEELQKAMSAGFKELKGKGVMRALWDWSKFVYKASRWATATYNVYRHPLMVRAIILALISSTRVILGFTVG